MLQSRLFAKISKEGPKEEPAINARLLEQAGFIQKLMAGVYTFLPLGQRVLSKIENIVRKNMDAIGSEMLMPSMHPKELWQQTGRWDIPDILPIFKVKSMHGQEYALGATHEEVVTPAAKKSIMSYRDLPIAVYQIQTKFRDELRAKSGLLRGREFRMKDLYSFHVSQQDLDDYYLKCQQVYSEIFGQLGLNTILTEASGGSFAKFSHEFQVELPSGEDTIYVCEKCGLAKNKEIFSGQQEQCTNCGPARWRETKAAEVGNIFKLGTKFTSVFGIDYLNNAGKTEPVIMGCYGLGTTRAMGVIAELHNDQDGLIWPENVAPFKIHLLALPGKNDNDVFSRARELYADLQKAGIEVLFDDRHETAGIKFKDADLIGIPWKLIISEKSLAQSKVELKRRGQQESNLAPLDKIITAIM